MKLDKLESPKRTARVAAFAPAIQAARARGVTWLQIVQEIGPAVGIDPSAPSAPDSMRSAFKAALAQIEKGRLMPAPAPKPSAAAPGIAADAGRSEPPARQGFKRIKID